MKDFFNWYIKERYSIYEKKEIRGEPFPWTADPILQKYHFCNVFIEDDTTSKWISEKVKGKSIEQQIKTIIISRIINNPDFLDATGFPPDVEKVKNYKGSVRSQAYLSVFSPKYSKKHKEQWINMQPDLQAKLSTVKELLNSKNRKEAWSWLRKFGFGVGDFIAFVIIEDLHRNNILQYPDNWVFIGPGAAPMLKLLNCSIEELRDAAPVLRRKLDLMDIEHNLCEAYKYIKYQVKGTKRRLYYV